MSTESDAIRGIAQEYMSAINSGDLDKWLGTLTDDVVFLPPDQPLVSGKNAVREWAKETFFDPFRMKLNLSFDEIEVFGDTATTYGRCTLFLSPTGGGSATEMVGKFIDIFRRESDGAWRFARAMFNFDKPVGS
ncbi:MAG: SgcJ/EcaC family oxidoreductase [Acidobacteria bacterium]|nr:SgcJ/EcaC family oxidoreductase [Acidobacteriota bacterium]